MGELDFFIHVELNSKLFIF